MGVADTRGDQPGPSEFPAAQSETADSNDTAASSKSARKKRIAPPSRPAEMELLTVEDRLKKLANLPSMDSPPAVEPEDVRAVDALIYPPMTSPPAPPPSEKEPTASQLVDRGSTIPDNYGLDRLVSLPRDAHWIYVYWELHGGAIDRLRFHHSAEFIDNARWVLRVRPVNISTPTYIDVDMRIGQWYLHAVPGTRFAIDMGLFDQQGQFVEVLRGNEVATPLVGVSPVCDERWIILREELQKLLKVSGAATEERELTGGGSEQFARSEQPRAIGIFASHLKRQ
jgi:hypothetical protein